MFEKLTAKAQDQILESLYMSASALAENSGGLMVAYEPDLERFKHASLSVDPSHFRVDGEPLEDLDQVDFIAGSIDKRYPAVPGAIELQNDESKDPGDGGSAGTVDLEGEVLRSGQNLIEAYEHIELLDVALGGVAYANRHRRRGIEHRSVLVASKAIDLLGINLRALKNIPPEVARGFLNGIGVQVEDDDTVQARSFLKIAFDETYLTFPSSKTFMPIRRTQKEAIKAFNALSVGSLVRDMNRSNEGGSRPIKLSGAMPGTTVKLLDIPSLSERQKEELGVSDGDEVYVIGSINPAIGRFTRHGLTFVHALRLDEKPPVARVDRNLMCVRTEEDVQKLGARMVSMAHSLEPGKRFIQDAEDNLPVVRIPAAA